MRKEDICMDDIYNMFEKSNYKPLINIIKEKKEKLNLSNLQLSNILSIDKTTLDRLLERIEKGDVKSIDFYQILKISQFFNVDIKELSQYYVNSLNSENISQLEKARIGSYVVNRFDLKGLKKIGFIDNVNDIQGIEQRIKSFFNLSSIYSYDDRVGLSLFSRTKRISDDKMRVFWLNCAYYQFEKINNPNDFDKEKLLAIIPKIRPYTRYEENGFKTVIQALYNVGITVILQSYLAKTQVRGATFVVNNKPCIVITDFGKTYATIWFALLHELFHVLYDLEELKTWKFHLTGDNEPELNLFREEYADYFAMEILFSKEKLNFVRSIISSPNLVSKYAEENKIHPSIIYSFYCYEENKKGNDYYPFYQKYFGKPDKLYKQIKTNPYNKETIFEEIESIKRILEPINI